MEKYIPQLFMAGLMGMFFWWLKGLATRLDDLNKNITKLNLRLTDEYVKKEDRDRETVKCDRKFAEIFSRLRDIEKEV